MAKPLHSSRVKDIIGISEFELVKLDNNQKEQYIDRPNNRFILHNTEYGRFDTLSIKALKKQTKHMSNYHRECPPFTILNGVDIGQYRVADNSIVQVASNFNCLELPNHTANRNSGYLVDKCHLDSTQGPAACLGPLSGYLYRAHFREPINLLSDVKDYFGIPVNGKLILKGDEKKISDNNMDQVVDNVRIGLHTDLPVLYDRSGLIDRQYKVDQVFNSTINFYSYGDKTDLENRHRIARTLLRASYQGAFMSAILRNSEYLYLTLIGGGVFANPLDIILEEMVKAYREYANHPKSKLIEVYLCLYENNDYIAEYLKMQQ